MRSMNLIQKKKNVDDKETHTTNQQNVIRKKITKQKNK